LLEKSMFKTRARQIGGHRKWAIVEWKNGFHINP
jgi:hypothetical protein